MTRFTVLKVYLALLLLVFAFSLPLLHISINSATCSITLDALEPNRADFILIASFPDLSVGDNI